MDARKWKDRDTAWKIGFAVGAVESAAAVFLFPGSGVLKGGINLVFTQSIGIGASIYHDRQKKYIESTYAGTADLATKLDELENSKTLWDNRRKNLAKGLAASGLIGSVGFGAIDEFTGNTAAKVPEVIGKFVGSVPQRLGEIAPRIGTPTISLPSVNLPNVGAALDQAGRGMYTLSSELNKRLGIPLKATGETQVPASPDNPYNPNPPQASVEGYQDAGAVRPGSNAAPEVTQPAAPAGTESYQDAGAVRPGSNIAPETAAPSASAGAEAPQDAGAVRPGSNVVPPEIINPPSAPKSAIETLIEHNEAPKPGSFRDALAEYVSNHQDAVQDYEVQWGDTAGKILSKQMGGDIEWQLVPGSDAWEGFAALRAMNPEVFADLQQHMNLSDAEFDALIEKVQKGDNTAYRQLIKHMGLIKAGTKIKILSPDAFRAFSAAFK